MMSKDMSACKHLNFRIRGNDPMGKAYCPDCKKLVYLSDCFQNLAEEMQEVLAKMKGEE